MDDRQMERMLRELHDVVGDLQRRQETLGTLVNALLVQFNRVMPDVRRTLDAAPPIRTCPHCGTRFVKHRKQVYCSPRCSQQTRWARYAAKRAARDYAQERAHAKYTDEHRHA